MSERELFSFGTKHRVICINNIGYRGKLTINKQYTIKIAGEIVDVGMLCSLIGDDNKEFTCMLNRFKEKK